MPISNIGPEHLFSVAQRLHSNKHWAPAAFSATVLLYEYNRRQEWNIQDHDINLPFQGDKDDVNDEEWEEKMRKSYLKERGWKNPIWTKVEDEDILAGNDGLNVRRFNASSKHSRLLTS